MSGGVVVAASDGVAPGLSMQRLLLLFVLALLLFCGQRWDSSSWLQQHLLPRLASYGVHAAAVVQDGDTLRFQQVTVDGVAFAGAPVQWDEVVVAPKWSALLRLRAAVQLSMRWQQAKVDAEVAQVDEGHLAIRQMKLSLPLTMVTPLLPPMPVSLAGDLLCQGAVVLNRVQVQLEKPDVVCDWQQATATMGGKPTPLGSYQMTLHSKGADWQWGLSGGEVAKVKGMGLVHPAVNVAMAEWPIDGSLTVHAGSGSLGAMVGAMLGAQPHRISGRLAAPEFH